MMATSRDFAGSPAVRLRYGILSAPRSGSTLLARGLFRTGLAGDPHEYLNPAAITAYQAGQAGGPARLEVREYLRRIESRRTSPNGYFGIKAHYFHLARLGATEKSRAQIVQGFLKGTDRLILITRRDKLAQAVSYYIAKASGRWTTEHEKYLPPGVQHTWNFDPVAIGRCLQRTTADEAGWRNALAVAGLPYIEVVFEDLIASYQTTMEKVAAYLGIDIDMSRDIPAVGPTTDACAADLRERFRSYLSNG